MFTPKSLCGRVFSFLLDGLSWMDLLNCCGILHWLETLWCHNQSLIRGHLGCFQGFTLTNLVALSCFTHPSLGTCAGRERAGSQSMYSLHLLNCCLLFKWTGNDERENPQWRYHAHLHPTHWAWGTRQGGKRWLLEKSPQDRAVTGWPSPDRRK